MLYGIMMVKLVIALRQHEVKTTSRLTIDFRFHAVSETTTVHFIKKEKFLCNNSSNLLFIKEGNFCEKEKVSCRMKSSVTTTKYFSTIFRPRKNCIFMCFLQQVYMALQGLVYYLKP